MVERFRLHPDPAPLHAAHIGTYGWAEPADQTAQNAGDGQASRSEESGAEEATRTELGVASTVQVGGP